MCSINHDLETIFIHNPKSGGLFIQDVLEEFYNFKTYYFTHENHESFINNDLCDILNEDHYQYGFLQINTGGILKYYMSSNIHNSTMNMTEDKWKKYKKIAVIRNPYDRFISGFNFLLTNLNKNNLINEQEITVKEVVREEPYEKNIKNEQELHNLSTIIKKTIKNKSYVDLFSYFHLFITQQQHLLNTNNEIEIDYLIPFEDLNRQLCQTLFKIGITKIKHTHKLLNNIKINKKKNYNFCNYYDDDILEFVNNYFDEDFKVFKFKKVFTLMDLLLESQNYYKEQKVFEKDNMKLINELNNNTIYKHNIKDNIKQISSSTHEKNLLTLLKNSPTITPSDI